MWYCFHITLILIYFFQCDVAEVCKVFAQYDFLYSIPFHKYSHIMDKLLGKIISKLSII